MSSYTHPPNMTQLPYYQQVLCGMAYIDSQLPGQRWHDDVPLEKLDMGIPSDDVLKHTLGLCYNGLETSQELGFSVPNDHPRLTDTWRAMLRLRNALPTLPEGHVFLGVGNEQNNPLQHDVRHCFGWNIGNESFGPPRWDQEWSLKGFTSMAMNRVAYCVDRRHPLAQALLIVDDTPQPQPQPQPEEETMTNDYRAEVEILDDGFITCYGYTFSPDDVQQLEAFVNNSSKMEGAGFDMEIAAITIGCRRFDVEEVRGLIGAYREKKREQDNPLLVTAGSRVIRGGATYIVAQIGDDQYMLVSLKTGNRHNSIVVWNPEDRHNIPLANFLTEGDKITNWSKA